MRCICTCYACTGSGRLPRGKYLERCSAGDEWYGYYDGVFIVVRTSKLIAERDLNDHVYRHLKLRSQLRFAPRFKRLPKADRYQLLIQHPSWVNRLERAQVSPLNGVKAPLQTAAAGRAPTAGDIVIPS